MGKAGSLEEVVGGGGKRRRLLRRGMGCLRGEWAWGKEVGSSNRMGHNKNGRTPWVRVLGRAGVIGLMGGEKASQGGKKV